MAACGAQMSNVFFKMMAQPISETIYHLELLKELNEELAPKEPKPGFDDNEFVRRDRKEN